MLHHCDFQALPVPALQILGSSYTRLGVKYQTRIVGYCVCVCILLQNMDCTIGSLHWKSTNDSDICDQKDREIVLSFFVLDQKDLTGAGL